MVGPRVGDHIGFTRGSYGSNRCQNTPEPSKAPGPLKTGFSAYISHILRCNRTHQIVLLGIVTQKVAGSNSSVALVVRLECPRWLHPVLSFRWIDTFCGREYRPRVKGYRKLRPNPHSELYSNPFSDKFMPSALDR